MLKNNILQTKGITMKNKVNSKLEWIRNFFFDSRKDGADRIGVTANYLCQIETGTKVPRLKGLCKFSYAYGIPLDILFSDERRFLIYSIEAMSALSEKSEIDKLIEGLQCLQKSLTLQSQEDESQPGTEKQVNTASDWINTGNSYEIVRTDSPNGPKQRRRRHRSNIAKYRRRKGYTQETLSEAAGISNHYQTELETTKPPSVDLLKRLSRILETPMFFLYQSKIDYKNFDVYEQLDRLDDDVLQSLLLTLLDLKNRKKRIGETGHEK